MKRKKIAVALAVGLTLGTTFAAPVTASVAEAANESVMKLKSPAETYAAQGKKLFDEGKFTEAGEAYENAAKEAKNNDEYWFLCGLSYFRAESYKTASEPLKKAIKLKSNEGLYNYFYGLSLWNWARAVRSGKSSSTFSGTDDLMDKGDQYVKRAAELMPDDVNVQMAAGTIAENYANYLARSGGYRSYINEEYQRAYQHFRRAAELDPSKGENQTRFANEHPGYGFQPYKPATPPAPRGNTDVSGSRSNTPIDSAPGVDKQPGTEGQPGGNVDVTNNIPPHTFTPVNYESQSLIAFCPLGMEDGGWSEIYRNPYIDGGEFVILTGRNGKPAYQRFGFDYNRDTEEFTFTGVESVLDGDFPRAMDYYWLKGHVIDDETVYVERVVGDRPNAPTPSTDAKYPHETYKLQIVRPTEDILYHFFLWSSDKQDYVHTLNIAPYRFVSVEHSLYLGDGEYYTKGMIDDWHDTIPVSTMFAVRAFLAEGGDLEEVGAPPQGMTLPRYDNLKNKEMYTKRQ